MGLPEVEGGMTRVKKKCGLRGKKKNKKTTYTLKAGGKVSSKGAGKPRYETEGTSGRKNSRRVVDGGKR